MKLTLKSACGLFTVGAAAGAAVTLFYAPRSGAQTRKNVRRFTTRTVHSLDDLQQDIREKVGGWVEDSKHRIEKILA